MNGILSNPFVGIILGGLFALSSIRYLRKQHATAVHTVFYAFSLALVATSIIGAWGVSEDIIGPNGSFNGDAGKRLNSLLTMMVDIRLDCMIAIGTAGILIVPQIFGYVLSGLFGCATRPQFVDQSIKFALWLIVKSLAVAGGVIAAILIFAVRIAWSAWSGSMPLQAISIVSQCLGFALALVAAYYYCREELRSELENMLPEGSHLWRLDRFLRRCSPTIAGES
ncbi:MAG: hypothetical protein JWN73_1962 [Betaproteobacteria bacterium]|nr:hypothetical protein [Betaproteobacteria bacterium]